MPLIVDNDAKGRPIVEYPNGKIKNRQTGEDVTSKYKNVTQPTQTTPTYSYSGGGGSYSGGSSYDYSGLIDSLKTIMHERDAALEKMLLKNKQQNDDEANKRYAMKERQWEKMYGNGRSGQGLSYRAQIQSDRDSDLRENAYEYDTNKYNLLYNKYNDYYNLASSLSGINSDSLKKILGSL